MQLKTCIEIFTIFFKEIEELRGLIGEEVAVKLLNASEDSYKFELKTCFKQLMTCSQERVTGATEKLFRRFSLAGSSGSFFVCYLTISSFR